MNMLSPVPAAIQALADEAARPACEVLADWYEEQGDLKLAQALRGGISRPGEPRDFLISAGAMCWAYRIGAQQQISLHSNHPGERDERPKHEVAFKGYQRAILSVRDWEGEGDDMISGDLTWRASARARLTPKWWAILSMRDRILASGIINGFPLNMDAGDTLTITGIRITRSFS